MSLVFISYVSHIATETGNTEICADIFSLRTQLFVFEEDLKEYNGSSRNKVVSQTHTICNLGVCLCVCVCMFAAAIIGSCACST